MNLNVLLLLLVTLVWGTTFPLLKMASQHLSGMEVSVVRFIIASICMSPFALKLTQKAWRDGAFLGVVGLIAYVTQAYGLQLISSNRSAFLTSLNVLFVPFLAWVLGSKLSAQVVLAAILACCGIGLMSWEGGGNMTGDMVTVLSALFYAIYVLLLARMVKKHTALALAASQIIMMALIGIALLAFEGTTRLSSLPQRLEPVLPVVLFLGVIATAAMLFIQAIGQRHVSPTKAALIFSLEPAFAAMFAWLWLGEQLTVRSATGGALVVVAVVMSEWQFSKKPKQSSR